MLQIKIVKTDKNIVELQVQIPKRKTISQQVHYYSSSDIEKKIIEKLKEEKLKFDSFLTDVKDLKNKLDKHLTQQTVQVKIKLAEKKVTKPRKTKKSPSKVRRDHKEI
tara:strand:- start:994 stop:1317 length:324 start_codon:yes stop_codon:yes gene_type:complete